MTPVGDATTPTDLVAAVGPGKTVLDDGELATLTTATAALLRAGGDSAREEYTRFLDTSYRGIAIDEDGLANLHRGATVLVTGGTGCIGSALLRQLMTFSPARVVSISRGVEARWPLSDGVEYRQLDIRNGPALTELVRELRPDVVYHLAAQHDPGLAERELHRTLSTNVTGTANVIAACRSVPGVRLACASTGKALRPFTRDIYAASKKMTEWLLAETAVDPAMTVSAVRFTHVVDNSIILQRLHEWSDTAQPVRLHSVDTMFYVQSAREAAQLLMSSVLETRRQRFSLATIRDLGWPVSLLELALGVLASTGSRSPLYVCGFEDGYEKAPYPGLYDPLVSGAVSPLFNSLEAFEAEPARACADLDVHRPSTPSSTRVGAIIRQLCRAAAAGSSVDQLRSAVEACGWAMWEDTVASTPLPVRQRHAVLVAGTPDAAFSDDDQRVRAAVERSLHRPSRSRSSRIPALARASTLDRLALGAPA